MARLVTCDFEGTEIRRKYRITKYDPALRDEEGRYMADDWTDWSDIGKSYNGCMLDAHDYKVIENKYIEIAAKILKHKTVTTMEIEDLEDPHEAEEISKYINVFRTFKGL